MNATGFETFVHRDYAEFFASVPAIAVGSIAAFMLKDRLSGEAVPKLPGPAGPADPADLIDPTGEVAPLVAILVLGGATIGAGCTIGNDLTIGRFAMVGMGSLVTKSVGDFLLVVGSPAAAVNRLRQTAAAQR